MAKLTQPTENIPVFFSDVELEKVTTTAASMGMSVEEFIRHAALEAAAKEAE